MSDYEYSCPNHGPASNCGVVQALRERIQQLESERDVPEPLREAIRGQIVYLANPHAVSGNTQLSYESNWESHRNWLRDGFLHATQEAAILHSKALLSLTARSDA